VGVGTISGILHRGHIPKIDTLFRLADTLNASRERVLRLAADLPPEPEGGEEEDDYLIPELLEEFRQLPDEWKLAALEQVETLRRLAERPPMRIIVCGRRAAYLWPCAAGVAGLDVAAQAVAWTASG
jgi:transcriptional regulator with XRE-family HTH domain